MAACFTRVSDAEGRTSAAVYEQPRITTLGIASIVLHEQTFKKKNPHTHVSDGPRVSTKPDSEQKGRVQLAVNRRDVSKQI